MNPARVSPTLDAMSTTENEAIVVVDPGEWCEIVQACTRMGRHTDRREWDRLVEVFADEVVVDYTSLHGGEPATIARDQLVAAWQRALGELAATQHLIANQLVETDDDRAVCTADFQATHVRPNPHGDPVWTLGGHYRFELRRLAGRWRIAGLTMTAVWATGNPQVLTAAADSGRATTGEPT